MLVIGHRGALWEALENSFSSFHKAVEAGCQRIELDVWGGKDASLWVCHDESLERTSKSSKLITELNQVELQKIELKNNEKLPSLDSVLKEFLPKIELNLELKDFRKEVLSKLISVVSKHELNSKIIISSFEPNSLKFIKNKAPQLKLALLWENEINSKAFSLLEENPHWIVHPQADKLTPEDMEQFYQLKKIVYPWVPRLGVENEEREKLWKKMKDLKVHGLCTNYPREFQQWLAQG